MFTRIFLSLTLIGCTAEVQSPPDPPAKQERKVVGTPTEPVRQVKTCDVVSTEKVRDCILYHLMCDDGEPDMVLQCAIQPIGVITNPPRPI